MAAFYLFRKGESISSICSKYKISRITFYHWRRQWNNTKSVKPIRKSSWKWKLIDESKQKLIDFYKDNPTATNKEGSAYLHFKIKPSTVSDYLKCENFTIKKVSDELQNYPDERILQETREFFASIQNIPVENRVYMIESFVYDNEAHNMGRSIRG